MSSENYNLEEEFGSLLDAIERHISELTEESLTHYGVKGMKWGVRKESPSKTQLVGLGPDRIVRKTSLGETITITKDPPNAMHKAFGKTSKKYRNAYNNGATLEIKNSKGETVGNLNIWKPKTGELYVNTIGVKNRYRGKGYATAVMKATQEYAKRDGFDKVTLDVPSDAPDARHIYEKLGFKALKDVPYDPKDPSAGGVTEMEYPISKIKHDGLEEILAHYGVKGMKWGVRSKNKSLAEGNSSTSNKITSGKSSSRRTGPRIKQGQKTRNAKSTRNDKVRAGLSAAYLAGLMAYVYGPSGKAVFRSAMGTAASAVNSRANMKRAEAGAEAARNMMADAMGLANYRTIRVAYDPSRNEWA